MDLFGYASAAEAAVAAAPALLDPATIQLLTLFITTVGGIVMAWLAFKTASIGKNQIEMGKSQVIAAEQIQKLEKNTNSIKDELVATSIRMGHAEGKVEVLQKETTAIIQNGLPAKPAPATTVNMAVKEMRVEELNVPDKKEKP